MTQFVSAIHSWPQAFVAGALVIAVAAVVVVMLRAFFVGR